MGTAKKSDIRQELLKLNALQGNDFVRQLRQIVARKEFHPLVTDPQIFRVGGEDDADYPRLLDAARKVVIHGYRVYMLPNPHGIRTADFQAPWGGVRCDMAATQAAAHQDGHRMDGRLVDHCSLYDGTMV